MVVRHVEPGMMAALVMMRTLHGLGGLPGSLVMTQHHDKDCDAYVDDDLP